MNMLAAHHSHVADLFAGRFDRQGLDRFEGASWRTLRSGAPILNDAVTAFDCEVEQTIEKHSHYVIFGRVCATLSASVTSSPLLYWRRRYREMSQPSHAKQNASSLLQSFDW